MSKEIENEKVIKYGPESATRNLANNGITEEIAKGNKKCIKYIGISIGIVLIIALIIVIIIISGGKSPTPPIEPTTPTAIIVDPPIIPDYFKQNGPIEKQEQYELKTEKDDFKSIFVNQRYYEDIMVNGVLSQTIVDRKTNYHIYHNRYFVYSV